MGGKAKPGKLGSRDKVSCLCLASCCAGMLSPWKSSFAALSAKKRVTKSIGCRGSVYLSVCVCVCANTHPGVYVRACVCKGEGACFSVCARVSTCVLMCSEATSSSPLCLALSSYKEGSVSSLSIVLNADHLISAHKANTNRQGVTVCLFHHSLSQSHTHTHRQTQVVFDLGPQLGAEFQFLSKMVAKRAIPDPWLLRGSLHLLSGPGFSY